MPELPEVETIVRDLQSRLPGKLIRDLKLITPSIWRNGPPSRRRLIGRRIIRIARRGKHVLIHLSDNHALVVHLKMTGRLTCNKPEKPLAKHTHVVLNIDNMQLRFNDVRRFGYIDLVDTRKLDEVAYLASLGPDPQTVSEDEFVSLLKSKNRIVKSLLLDQNVISGLGNIYSDEALFAAGIHPRRVSSSIAAVRLKRLHRVIIDVLERAVAARGSSVDDYVDSFGRPGAYQNSHRVYGREGEPCGRCGSMIKREKIGSRSSHFCPRCQR